MKPLTLQLTAAEVIAVMDYIFQHTRTSPPNSQGYKVWRKMFDFIEKIHDQERVEEDANTV